MNSDLEAEPELEVVGRAMVLSPVPRSLSWAGEGAPQQQGIVEYSPEFEPDVEATEQDISPVRPEMQLMAADTYRVSSKGESSSLLYSDASLLHAPLVDQTIGAKKVFSASTDADLIPPEGLTDAKQKIAASMTEKRDWHAAIRQCLKRRVCFIICFLPLMRIHTGSSLFRSLLAYAFHGILIWHNVSTLSTSFD